GPGTDQQQLDRPVGLLDGPLPLGRGRRVPSLQRSADPDRRGEARRLEPVMRREAALDMKRMVFRIRAGAGCAVAASAFLLASAPGTAAADPKVCIHAHATGQRESKAGHLKLASQLFTSCGSDETCPDQLRKECADFLAEVTRTIPTVVFSALDENGKDLVNV